MANCIICAEFDNCPWRAEPNAMCSRYRQRKMTNGDRIRSMLDEELAEFIGCDPMHDICPNNCNDDWDRPCKVCVLDWLKKEANDEN